MTSLRNPPTLKRILTGSTLVNDTQPSRRTYQYSFGERLNNVNGLRRWVLTGNAMRAWGKNLRPKFKKSTPVDAPLSAQKK